MSFGRATEDSRSSFNAGNVVERTGNSLGELCNVKWGMGRDADSNAWTDGHERGKGSSGGKTNIVVLHCVREESDSDDLGHIRASMEADTEPVQPPIDVHGAPESRGAEPSIIHIAICRFIKPGGGTWASVCYTCQRLAAAFWTVECTRKSESDVGNVGQGNGRAAAKAPIEILSLRALDAITQRI
ncbi:hypothetical protein L227DRAFT_565339 [Lentinus tigrinus ALCF2SS1-6]|uniref:Uncharacterized protein n=1 Tax=Lentinus tigrinus ALCF2SS1-6 TaxID=1328759 RepID=A0A5C2S3Y5_9APHY|nr:hypothetical protein L227DRAFT_565339 [Lentinus tigrinus ALCF2SS1-6]